MISKKVRREQELAAQQNQPTTVPGIPPPQTSPGFQVTHSDVDKLAEHLDDETKKGWNLLEMFQSPHVLSVGALDETEVKYALKRLDKEGYPLVRVYCVWEK